MMKIVLDLSMAFHRVLQKQGMLPEQRRRELLQLQKQKQQKTIFFSLIIYECPCDFLIKDGHDVNKTI